MAIFSTIIAGSVIYTGLKYTEKLLNEKHSEDDKESENQNQTPVTRITHLAS